MATGYLKTQIKQNQIEDKFFKYYINGNKIKFYLKPFYDGYKVVASSAQEITVASIDSAITRIDLIYLKTDGIIDIIYGTVDNVEPDYDFKNVILKITRTGITNIIIEDNLEYFKDDKYIKLNLYTIEENSYLSDTDTILSSYGV